jgi:hypothetical protein
LARVDCCGVAEKFKRADGEEENEGDAAASLPRTVASVGAPSAAAAAPGRGRNTAALRLLRLRTRRRPWARQARRRRGFTESGAVSANRAAARSSVGSVKIK